MYIAPCAFVGLLNLNKVSFPVGQVVATVAASFAAPRMNILLRRKMMNTE